MKIFKIASTHNNILIHTDITRGIKIPFISKKKFLFKHYSFLKKNLPNTNLFFPSFNYEFLKSGNYNVINDAIQVGILNEYIRLNHSNYRTLTPVFSFIGKEKPENYKEEITNIIDPFGDSSFFNYLQNSDSGLIHYGSKIDSTTLIHYVERISNKLNYRYNKYFKGKIYLSEKNYKNVNLKYHVKPLRLYQNYDWKKIKLDLINNNLLINYKKERCSIIYFPISKVVNFWLNKLNNDSLYFLDSKSKNIVNKKLSKTGKKFELNDFE